MATEYDNNEGEDLPHSLYSELEPPTPRLTAVNLGPIEHIDIGGNYVIEDSNIQDQSISSYQDNSSEKGKADVIYQTGAEDAVNRPATISGEPHTLETVEVETEPGDADYLLPQENSDVTENSKSSSEDGSIDDIDIELPQTSRSDIENEHNFVVLDTSDSEHSSAVDEQPYPSIQREGFTPAGSIAPSTGQPTTLSCQQTVARQLIEHFTHRVQCSADVHQEAIEKHIHLCRENPECESECKGIDQLRQLFDPRIPNNEHIPNVLDRVDLWVGPSKHTLDKKHAKTIQESIFATTQMPDPEDLEQLYEGCGESGEAQNLCLHLHDRSSHKQQPLVTKDIDSFQVLATSLAVLRTNIFWVTCPPRLSNINSKLHGIGLRLLIPQANGMMTESQVPIETIPHFCLGKTESMGVRANIHILLPNLYQQRLDQNRLKSSFLTDAELALWFNRVWFPALNTVLDTGSLQEFPATWDQAYAESRARGTEQAVFGDTNEVGSFQQSISKDIMVESLSEIWDQVLENIQSSPDLWIFRDARILISSKDMKLVTQRRKWRLLRAFMSTFWLSMFDESYISESWVDIGRTVTPPGRPPRHLSDPASMPEPEVYLWKRCCLDTYYTHRLGTQKSTRLRKDIYHNSTMRDSASVVIVPDPKSHDFRGGLRYTHFYPKSKIAFVTSTTPVFGNLRLEDLAYDPAFRNSVAYIGGSGKQSNINVLANAYLNSKNRVAQAVKSGQERSCGAREEHRISYSLWLDVIDGLCEAEAEDAISDLDADNLPYYVIPSETYFGFIHGNVNRLCLGFEYTLASMKMESVHWEQTQMAVTFLHALRHSFSTTMISSDNLLWGDTWKRKQKDDEGGRAQCQGLALKLTIACSGFGWFGRKISWEEWSILPEYHEQYLTENPVLLQHYSKNWNLIRDQHDISKRLQLLQRWFLVARAEPSAGWWLMNYLVGLCAMQFRIDVWRQIGKQKNALREEFLDEAIHGLIPLVYGSIAEATIEGAPHLVSPEGKTAVKTPLALLDYLFDKEPFITAQGRERKRQHWEQLPYRQLYHKILDMFDRCSSKQLRRRFIASVKLFVLTQNYMLPYPDYNTFFARTKALPLHGGVGPAKTRRIWMGVTIEVGSLFREAIDLAWWPIRLVDDVFGREWIDPVYNGDKLYNCLDLPPIVAIDPSEMDRTAFNENCQDRERQYINPPETKYDVLFHQKTTGQIEEEFQILLERHRPHSIILQGRYQHSRYKLYMLNLHRIPMEPALLRANLTAVNQS